MKIMKSRADTIRAVKCSPDVEAIAMMRDLMRVYEDEGLAFTSSDLNKLMNFGHVDADHVDATAASLRTMQPLLDDLRGLGG